MTKPDFETPPSTARAEEHASVGHPPRLPEPGERFHYLASGAMTFQVDERETSGTVAIRGQEYVITEQMLSANTDRSGWCFLHLLHDPGGQELRYGRAIIGPGPFPTGHERTEPGTVEHVDARDEARLVALAIPDKDERAEALRDVAKRFGSAPVTSTTLATYGTGR